MSKVDPTKLSRLDRRSTILLQAAREHTDSMDEKGTLTVEDPGMDTLRGSFGAVGSIIRARTVRRLRESNSRDSDLLSRPPGAAPPHVAGDTSWMTVDGLGLGGLKRHQLYDAPVPRADDEQSIHSHLVNKRPTIKFGEQDLVHSYNRPGSGDNSTKHEHRHAHGLPLTPDSYPPQRHSSQNPAPDFLDMDTPPLKRSSDPTHSSEDWTESQTLTVRAELDGESEVHSAPPTMYARVSRTGRPTQSRKILNDTFDSPLSSPAAPERTTLLSFLSVTDSAPSEWSDDVSKSTTTRPQSKEGMVEKSKSKERNRPRTPKKYPPGGADDIEETESLWRKANSTEDDSDNASPPPEVGSVRLVQTKR